MGDILNKVRRLLADPSIEVDAVGFIVALLASILAAVIISSLYQIFYEKKATGDQIHRSFLLIAPSVTAIFIGIQFSLPLSLGLLGALSIIRFRTPIKEPEEVGFIMLVIAASVICATFQFVLLLALLVVATLALVLQRYLPILSGGGRPDGVVVITFNGSLDDSSRIELQRILDNRFNSGRVNSYTFGEEATMMQYAFSSLKTSGLNGLEEELKRVGNVARVSSYFNSNGSLV
jgi:hypothetical protein